MRTCKSCGISKPLERFSRHNGNRDNRRNVCKDCIDAEARRLRAEATPEAEAVRVRWRNWYHRQAAADPEWRTRQSAKALADRHRRRDADPVGFALAQKRSRRQHLLKANFDLTEEDYQVLLTAQGGVCAICHGPETQRHQNGTVRHLAVDHDHESGQVRGLLCGQCNNGLGRFSDDPVRLRSAAEYLEGAPAVSSPAMA